MTFLCHLFWARKNSLRRFWDKTFVKKSFVRTSPDILFSIQRLPNHYALEIRITKWSFNIITLLPFVEKSCDIVAMFPLHDKRYFVLRLYCLHNAIIFAWKIMKDFCLFYNVYKAMLVDLKCVFSHLWTSFLIRLLDFEFEEELLRRQFVIVLYLEVLCRLFLV